MNKIFYLCNIPHFEFEFALFQTLFYQQRCSEEAFYYKAPQEEVCCALCNYLINMIMCSCVAYYR